MIVHIGNRNLGVLCDATITKMQVFPHQWIDPDNYRNMTKKDLAVFKKKNKQICEKCAEIFKENKNG